MDSRKGEGSLEALREKGANEALRRLAVRLVVDKGMETAEVAGLPGRGEDWVKTGAALYAEAPPPPSGTSPGSAAHACVSLRPLAFVWDERVRRAGPCRRAARPWGRRAHVGAPGGARSRRRRERKRIREPTGRLPTL